ncbi:MAG: DUF5055 domain-containing protein [Faecalibacterium sp.]|nr:DUF5055 domain-containing protein [Ruminococcus sp.]MCM1391865.1 DUF5055 domain-containing protein [Ruminococcus sp.]MCM1485559.1 DUF5055 domain-containing protein [Faecalibacterium sp.]
MSKEKVNPIIITDNETNKEYTLEFSRESVKFAEMKRCTPDEVMDNLMTKLPEFFFIAFRMHHKSISREKTDKILFDDLKGVNKKFVTRLIELYNVPFDCLIKDDEESDESHDGEEKNAKMTVTF